MGGTIPKRTPVQVPTEMLTIEKWCTGVEEGKLYQSYFSPPDNTLLEVKPEKNFILEMQKSSETLFKKLFQSQDNITNMSSTIFLGTLNKS
ncbi:hypothetical protein PoB_003590900 [Plakobranchus ocellatus]|uniref:Uncharacterized protein n=1 Tax=Plakobranchus ocellatus TaxID=259542 RepID=A0AAV4ATF4_9GAST|nr:hypothetical protein PoB_003590900 [Plakobranchus ocellatus]